VISNELRTRQNIKTFAVASGKGGVGKTNITANLAIAMSRLGKKVMVVDADLGLSNLDILLNLVPQYTIKHVLDGTRTIEEVLKTGPEGIRILPAGKGVQDLTQLDEFQRLVLLEAFNAYPGEADVLLIDTAAGISENVTFFCSAAQEIIIVTTPEPTAITGAYNTIEVLYSQHQENKFNVLVNAARSKEEADEVFLRLTRESERFLNIALSYLGYLPFDESVRTAVSAQRAFIELFPGSPIANCAAEIAGELLARNSRVKGTLQFFLGNLLTNRFEVLQTEP
jgi:flagellar biosynthesis protein FlhG